ncbi:hypothetical protein STENM223S_07981 [Streptomyces tendae]
MLRRRRVADMVRDQAGADLVVLPELWTTGAFAYEEFGSEAEPLDGPTREAMAKAASDAGVWLHAGSVPERGPAGHPLQHLAGPLPLRRPGRRLPQDPPLRLRRGRGRADGAGDRLVTVRLPHTTLGVATCYDLRFPELFRGLVDAGAETLVVPAGWPGAPPVPLDAAGAGTGGGEPGVRPRLRNGRDARGSSAGGSLGRGGPLGEVLAEGGSRRGGPHGRLRPGDGGGHQGSASRPSRTASWAWTARAADPRGPPHPSRSFSARWITHTATAISSAGSASSRTTSTA